MCHFDRLVSETSLIFLNHCVQTEHQPKTDSGDSNDAERKSLRHCLCALCCAVIRSDADLAVSQVISGAAVTCSWPRCWSPGRRP